MLKRTLIASALLLCTFGAQAQVIGNSALMTQAFEQQLESYIGAGYLDFTNIFSKDSSNAAYNDSVDWHREVDNKGPTISLMEIINKADQSTVIIAGYNPFNWSSSAFYTYSSNTSSFLTNLTHNLLFQKNTNTTIIGYNHLQYGPNFGGGDFSLSNNLTIGSSNIGYSYGDRAMYGNTDYQQLFPGTGGRLNWTVGRLETFTLQAGLYEPITDGNNPVTPAEPTTPADPVSQPTPVSAPAMGGGLMLAMGLLGMRQRKLSIVPIKAHPWL
jgi:hypothetical protein